jgi:hypothetical protein
MADTSGTRSRVSVQMIPAQARLRPLIETAAAAENNHTYWFGDEIFQARYDGKMIRSSGFRCMVGKTARSLRFAPVAK